jgi:casein kinase I family protein HRR25
VAADPVLGSRSMKCINRTYVPVKKIGSGSFGDVYLGTNIIDGTKLAIKVEPKEKKRPMLDIEVTMYNALSGGVGIPRVMWYGATSTHNILILDLLGPSLNDLHERTGMRFSLKTVLMLADQLITVYEYIHSRNIIHRDVKPNNLLMGVGRMQHRCHIIDFGLSKRFIDPVSNVHIPFKEGKNLTGTARYASLYTHAGYEQSRRDDCEALGYVLVYFLRGRLPWQGIQAADKKELYAKIQAKKKRTTLNQLCDGLPGKEAFIEYIRYTRSLGFEELPNYDYMRGLFQDVFMQQGFKFDYLYDWFKDGPAT